MRPDRALDNRYSIRQTLWLYELTVDDEDCPDNGAPSKRPKSSSTRGGKTTRTRGGSTRSTGTKRGGKKSVKTKSGTFGAPDDF